MKTITKIALAACIGVVSLGSQLQTVSAKQMRPMSTASHHRYTNASVLRVGNRSPAVKNIQAILRREGYYKGPVNGVFTNRMRSSVIAFQKSEHIKADGVIGYRTRIALK